MKILVGVSLFAATAAAEIAGCYAAYAWLRLGRSACCLAPGAVSLALFAWLLTLHPMVGAGRVYAAYGGVYIVASLLWLWAVESLRPNDLGPQRCLPLHRRDGSDRFRLTLVLIHAKTLLLLQ